MVEECTSEYANVFKEFNYNYIVSQVSILCIHWGIYLFSIFNIVHLHWVNDAQSLI